MTQSTHDLPVAGCLVTGSNMRIADMQPPVPLIGGLTAGGIRGALMQLSHCLHRESDQVAANHHIIRFLPIEKRLSQPQVR